ncbi:hypothetical protein TTRE_0000495601 [Trichuris trichiura]|uniref:Uncharacterized protein n=1 Tax=Trichuris trichiura TaxID=36087 RepID=A0A077ZA82_TRITR|nr:hypothetical protein TTRE_0000495601 [Trichuris trichiura]
MCPPKGIRMPCEKLHAFLRNERSQDAYDYSSDEGASFVYTLLQFLVTMWYFALTSIYSLFCQNAVTPVSLLRKPRHYSSQERKPSSIKLEDDFKDNFACDPRNMSSVYYSKLSVSFSSHNKNGVDFAVDKARRVLTAVGMSSGLSPSPDKVAYDQFNLPPERTDSNEETHHLEEKECPDESKNYDSSLPNLSENVSDEDDEGSSKEEAIVESEECVPICSSPPTTSSEHVESALNAEVSEETPPTVNKKPKRVSSAESAIKPKLAEEEKAESKNGLAEAANFCYVCKLECFENLCIRCKRCDMLAHWDPMFCCLRYCLLSNGSSFFCPKCAGINSLTDSEALVEDYREPFIARNKCITCGSSLQTSAGQFGRTVYCSPDCINHLCDAAKKQLSDYNVERIPMVEPFVYGTSVYGSNAPSHRRLFSWMVNHPTFRPVFWLKSFKTVAVSTSTVSSSQSDMNEQCSSSHETSDAALPASTNISRCFACLKMITPDERAIACKNCSIFLHEIGSVWSCARFCFYNEHFVCPKCNTMTKLTGDCSSVQCLFKTQLTCTHCAYCGKPLASDLIGVSALCGSSCVDLTVDAVKNIIQRTHRRFIPMIEPFPGGKIVPGGWHAPSFPDLATFMKENPTLFPVLLLRTCNAQWTIVSSSGNNKPDSISANDPPSKDKETKTILSEAKKSPANIGKRSAAKCANNGKPRNRQPKRSRSTLHGGQNCRKTSSINNSNESVLFAEVVDSFGSPLITSDNNQTCETKNSSNSETDVSSEVVNCNDASPVLADNEQTSEVGRTNSNESVSFIEVASCIATLLVTADSDQTSEVETKNSKNTDETVSSMEVADCTHILPAILDDNDHLSDPCTNTSSSNETIISAEEANCIDTIPPIADSNRTTELEANNSIDNNETVTLAEVENSVEVLPVMTDDNGTFERTNCPSCDTVTSTEFVNSVGTLPAAEDCSKACELQNQTSGKNASETVLSAEVENSTESPDLMLDHVSMEEQLFPCAEDNNKKLDNDRLTEEMNECSPPDSSRSKQKKKKKKKIIYSSSESDVSPEAHPKRRVLPPKAKIAAIREKQRQEKRRPLRREENATAKIRRPDAMKRRQVSRGNNITKNILKKSSKPSPVRILDVSPAGLRNQPASEGKTKKTITGATASASAVISPALAIIEEFERKQADAIKAKQEAQTLLEGAEAEHVRDSNGCAANTCPNTPSTSTGDESIHLKRRRPSRWDVGDPTCRGSPNTVLWRGWIKFACCVPLRMALVPVVGVAIPVCKWLPETLDFTHACRKGPLLESYLQGCADNCNANIVVARFKEPLSTEQPRYRRRFQRLKEIDYYPVAIVGEGPPWFNISVVALDAEDTLPTCLRNLPGPGLPYLRRNAILLYIVIIDQLAMVHRPIFVFPDESCVNQSCTDVTSLYGNQLWYPPPFSLPQPVEKPSGYVSPMQKHCVPSSPLRPTRDVSMDSSLSQQPLGPSYSVQSMPVGLTIPAYGASAMPVSLVPPYPPPPLLFSPRIPNSTFSIPRKPY